MAEKIGNAITDEKNTVELLSAETALVSSGNMIASYPLQIRPSNSEIFLNVGIVMILEKDGEYYTLYSLGKITNDRVDIESENDITAIVKKFTFLTA